MINLLRHLVPTQIITVIKNEYVGILAVSKFLSVNFNRRKSE